MGLFPGFLGETGLEYFFEWIPPPSPMFLCDDLWLIDRFLGVDWTLF